MKREPPVWLGPTLTAARHQDDLKSWPWIFRLLHRLFVSRRCPACRYWREVMKQK